MAECRAGGGVAVALSVLALVGGLRRRRAQATGRRERSSTRSSPACCRSRRSPYMPYTAVKGDKIVGLDGEILQRRRRPARPRGRAAADRLQRHARRRAVAPRRHHRSAASRGPKERQKQGLFTDPPYYSPPAMGVRAGQDATRPSTTSRASGSAPSPATSGSKSIQAVPGAKLGAYPNAIGVFDDLGSGRLDVGFLDPLLIIYYQKQRPDQKIETQYLTPPTAAQVKAAPGVRVLPPVHDQLLPAQAGAEARGGDLRARSARCTRTARWRADQEVGRRPASSS